MAEVIVHFQMGLVPVGYEMVTIYIPDNTSTLVYQERDLPKGWNEFPYIPETLELGDKFIRDNNYCLLKLPSAVASGDFSILINPNHNEFQGIRILDVAPFPFDNRLFG